MEKLLKDLLKQDARPVFLTGAGISVASGIPSFRGNDPEAIWKNDILEKATLKYFLKDPAASWEWYRSRFKSLEDAEPNDAHIAITFLTSLIKDASVITQNIDGLHTAAGTFDVIEIHGNKDLVR